MENAWLLCWCNQNANIIFHYTKKLNEYTYPNGRALMWTYRVVPLFNWIQRICTFVLNQLVVVQTVVLVIFSHEYSVYFTIFHLSKISTIAFIYLLTDFVHPLLMSCTGRSLEENLFSDIWYIAFNKTSTSNVNVIIYQFYQEHLFIFDIL